jgi:hypothetical protein
MAFVRRTRAFGLRSKAALPNPGDHKGGSGYFLLVCRNPSNELQRDVLAREDTQNCW